ncbi:hypothetical protein O3G_MSEX014794 [Manduca sexta]|uniref:Uncharacterized protein n=1 Tax=Manduca sexta TaxID=7130 RepID=A0A921ZWG7_MANSE|nr:hypothetical protein O3G_MSEX014794 [Manduca sexta]
MLYTLVILVSIYFIDCKHIVTVDKDFSKIKTNQELAQHVKEILNRLKTFKVPVHPRIRLFYELLKQGMTKWRSLCMRYEYDYRAEVSGLVPESGTVILSSTHYQLRVWN